MNVTSRELISHSAALTLRDAGDPKMDQIRELLFGDVARENDARLAALEARVQALENSFADQVSSLTRRIEIMTQESNARRREAFEDVARGVLAFAEGVQAAARR
jgi:phage host-nuclease inhibitor protein Gam